MPKDNHKEFNEPVLETPVQEEAPKKEVKIGVVDGCAMLNVRVSPKITSDVLTVINRGTEVTLSGRQPKNGEWYRVRINDDLEGFCMSKFITVQ